MLRERGIINEDQLRTALSRQQRWGRRLGENLVALGFISDKQLAKVLGEIYRKPTVDIRTAPITREALEMVPTEFCQKHHLVPIMLKEVEGKKHLVVAMSDPSDIAGIDELRFMVKYPIFEVLSSATDIDEVIRNYHREASAAAFELMRDVTLSRIQEDVSSEFVAGDDLNRQEISEVRSLPDVADVSSREELILHSLLQLLVDKGTITIEEARKILRA